MIATDYIFGKKEKENNESINSYIFDSSSFYSDNQKFRIVRFTDRAEKYVRPSEIADGTYAAWLNGDSGVIYQMTSDGSRSVTAESHLVSSNYAPRLLTSGLLDYYEPISGLYADFFGDSEGELPENFVAAFVQIDPNNANNQRYSFGAGGLDSGFTINYRNNKTIYFGLKFKGQTAQHFSFSAGASNHDILTVIVLEVVNGQATWLVNNTPYSTYALSNSGWTWIDSLIGTNKIALGDRYPVPSSKPARYTHFSLYLNPTRTAQEISNELIDIYQ